MKIQDLSNLPARRPLRAEIAYWLVVAGLTIGLAFGALVTGEHKSERAHRALDTQYQHCVDRYGFGGEHFPECLRGGR